jgi:hypothetical protein
MSITEEFEHLPIRGVVAIAARCARWGRPLYRLPVDVPDRDRHERAVDNAIKIAEQYATGIAVSKRVTSRAASKVTEATTVAEAASGSSSAMCAASAYFALSAASAASDDLFAASASATAASSAALKAAPSPVPVNADLAALRNYSEKMTDPVGPVDPSEFGPLGPLWPDGTPDWYTPKPEPTAEELDEEGRAAVASEAAAAFEAAPLFRAEAVFEAAPSLVIVWDPDVLSAGEYAELVATLGDLVRAEGASGIERIRSRGYGVPCEADVFQ